MECERARQHQLVHRLIPRVTLRRAGHEQLAHRPLNAQRLLMQLVPLLNPGGGGGAGAASEAAPLALAGGGAQAVPEHRLAPHRAEQYVREQQLVPAASVHVELGGAGGRVGRPLLGARHTHVVFNPPEHVGVGIGGGGIMLAGC